MTKAKVLIVEDEWIIANDIKNSLMDSGYRVTDIATSGEEALAKIDEEPPDIVLMDIILPGKMNGIETTKAILARMDVPIIYLTAYDNQYLVDNAKKTDHYGYLLKPFRTRELNIAIDMALHKHQQRKERNENEEA